MPWAPLASGQRVAHPWTPRGQGLELPLPPEGERGTHSTKQVKAPGLQWDSLAYFPGHLLTSLRGRG